jgi:hypothetical protein
MIKRAGNIAIMILLLLATGGIPITRHYCGSSEKSFSVFSTPKACCNGQCDRCHNVFKFSKVNDAFEAGSSITATQTLTELVTLHASTCMNLLDHLYTSPFPDLNHQRNFQIAEAGPSPASLGNFRC